MKNPIKALSISLASLLCIVGSIGAVKYSQIQAQKAAGANFSQPPSAVNIYQVSQQQWPKVLSAVGSVKAEEGITVLAEVAGRVASIHVQSGEQVSAGTLLITLDSGNEQAQLNAAEAQLRLAQSNYQRLSRLHAQSSVSESAFETARHELDSAKANTANLHTSLEKKKIRAPFDGRLGIRKVDLGQDLQAGSPLFSLQSQNNLRVNFSLPQRWATLVAPGLDVQVKMIETDDKPAQGKINAIGAEVDELTRNIAVQASLENNTQQLMPGMAVAIDIILPDSSSYLVVPSTAVIYAPFGDTVFVIEENKESGTMHARQQFIHIAKRKGDFVAVSEGLNEGDNVASAGAFKLFNGQAVMISEKPETPYQIAPNPKDS